MEQKTTILCLFTLALTLYQCIALDTASFVGPNPYYSKSGIYSFSSLPSQQSNLAKTYSISFPQTQTNTSFQFGYSIHEINYQIYEQDINYTVIKKSQSTTGASLILYTNKGTRISKLNIKYLIVENIFGIYTFTTYWMKMIPKKKMISGTEVTQTVSTNVFPTINNLVWVTMSGIDVETDHDYNNEVHLQVNATVGSSSITYKVSTISSKSFYLNSVHLVAYVYDPSVLASQNRQIQIITGNFQSSSSSSFSYTDSLNRIRSFNTLSGLSSFHTVGNYHQFSISYSPNNKISISSSYAYKYFQFRYIIFQFLTCASTTPYLIVSNSTCVDVCPVSTITNNYLKQCEPSSICSSNCLTCSSVFTECLTCQQGKYLDSSSTCSSCMDKCQSCINRTSCSKCKQYYIFQSGSCQINCDLEGCSSCIVQEDKLKCVTCTSYGYFLYPQTQPIQCKSKCQDAKHAQNQQCDDGNSVQNDGCSSTCQIQVGYYCVDIIDVNDKKSICYNCMSNCESCSDSTSCGECSSGYLYVSNSSGNYCQALSCMSNCESCSDSTSCGECSSGYLYVSNSSGNYCQKQQTCVSISNCQQCTDSKCSKCSSGYILANNVCVSVCGDGVIIKQKELCDDGNLINGDGCTSVCEIEQSWSCLQRVNGSSQCSIASIQIKNSNIMKGKTSNSILKTFNIYPITQTISNLNWQTIISQSTSNIQIESIKFNVITGQLVIQSKYNNDIEGMNVQFNFNFPSQYPFKLQSSSVKVSTQMKSENNLALFYYSQQDYLKAQIIKYIALILVSIVLIMFLIGLYAGKIIAIQNLVIFQLTSFIIMPNEQISPYMNSLNILSISSGYKIIPTQNQLLYRNDNYNYLSFNLIQNFNLSTILIFLPLIIGLAIFVGNKIKNGNNNSVIKQMSSKILIQTTIYGLFFCSYIFWTSVFAQMFAKKMPNYQSFIISILIIIIQIFLVFVYLNRPKQAGQFYQNVKKIKNTSKYFYIIYFAQRIIVSCILVIPRIPYKSGIISIIFIALLVYVAINRPYTCQGFTLRAILNCICIILILIINLILQLTNDKKQLSFYCVLAIQFILASSLIYNSYYFVKQIKQYFNYSSQTSLPSTKQSFISQEDKIFDQQRKKYQNNLMNSILNDNINNQSRQDVKYGDWMTMPQSHIDIIKKSILMINPSNRDNNQIVQLDSTIQNNLFFNQI